MILRPRPFFIVAARRKALQFPFDTISVEIPMGPEWVLKWIAVDYPRTVAAGAQTSPDLRFQLFDSMGRALTDESVPFFQVISPSGLPNFANVRPWNVVYPSKSVITMLVTGQVAGPTPANISITYHGVRGWWGAR